jgi:sugar-specific transcriptional regulator TrmB
MQTLPENGPGASESSSKDTTFKRDGIHLALGAEDLSFVKASRELAASDKVVSDLVQLGLSKDQAKVYTSGSRIGRASAKAIAKECSLDLSTTYSRLKELARVGLFEIELGTPNLYIALYPDAFLEKCKSGLAEQEQIVDQIATEIAVIQKMHIPSSSQKGEPSYRIFFNRTQHFNSSLKFWRESKKEVLQISPARLFSRMTDERLSLIKASCKNGVTWRWITDIKESSIGDVALISRYSEVRYCPRLSFSLAIFDRNVVFFCVNPRFVSTPENANEAHFTFNDATVAQAFVVLFESLWKTSSKLPAALPSIETIQIRKPALGDL